MKVMIGTPSYGGMFCAEYVMSLALTVGTLAQHGVPAMVAIQTGNPFVDQARNELVREFLESDCTDLLFIDDDVGWEAHKVTRVLSHPQPIVAGLVPKRNKDREDEFHQNALTGVLSAEGLFQALEAPTAFMRIKREAFTRFRAAHGDALFFHSGTKKADWGEDIYFCRKIVEMGEYLWIDSDLTFTHAGRKVWRGNFYEHAIKSGLLVSAAA